MNDEEIPILHGPLTEEEKARLAEEERVKAEKATEAAYKKDQLELTKSSIRLTRANLRITWALVAFTAVGTVAAWVQACIGNRSMRASESAAIAAKSASDTAAQTLHEMQSGKGAQDTHTLAQQAVTQATQTTNLANDTQALVSASQRSADTAQRALADNRLTVQRDLRPYVHATRLGLTGDLFKGEVITGTAVVFNSGRTPAVNVHGCGDLVMLTNGSPMTDDFPCPAPNNPKQTITEENSSFVLGSGASDYTIKSPGTTIKPQDFPVSEFQSLLATSNFRLYFYGDIFYSDITHPKTVLHSTFCGRYNVVTGGLDICEKHNKMN
jgi:hypothetical protein